MGHGIERGTEDRGSEGEALDERMKTRGRTRGASLMGREPIETNKVSTVSNLNNYII